MNKFLVVALLLTTFLVKGQNEEDFEYYGELMFKNLVLFDQFTETSIIFKKEYRAFIRDQQLSDFEKEKYVYSIDTGYHHLFNEYIESYEYFRTNYKKAREEGATFEYVSTYYYPLEELKNTYGFEVTFLYKTYNMRNEVTIRFDAVWYKAQFLIFSGFTEDF